MLAQSRRRWANIKSALVRRLVFAADIYMHTVLSVCLIIYSPLAQQARDIDPMLLAPAVTVGETKGAMDSTSVFFGLFFCL